MARAGAAHCFSVLTPATLAAALHCAQLFPLQRGGSFDASVGGNHASALWFASSATMVLGANSLLGPWLACCFQYGLCAVAVVTTGGDCGGCGFCQESTLGCRYPQAHGMDGNDVVVHLCCALYSTHPHVQVLAVEATGAHDVSLSVAVGLHRAHTLASLAIQEIIDLNSKPQA